MSIKNNNVFFKNNVLYHIDSSGDVEVISFEPNSGSGGYLLAGDYIKIEDNTIDVDYNLSGLATISSVNNLSAVYQPIGDYLTDGDLTGYQPIGDYLTEVDLSNYLTEDDLDGLATISSVNNLSGVYQPIGDYLTDVDLTGYQPVGNYLTEDDLTGYQPVGNYLTEDDLTGYQPIGDYLTEVDLSNYLTEDDLDGLATISSVNNLSAVYQPIGNYLTEVDLSNYLTENDLDGLATTNDINNLTAVYQPIGNYLTSIPTATTSEIGGIKVGSNLSIDNNGYLNAIAGDSYNFSGTNGVGVNLSDDTYTIKINDNLYSAISAQKILWGSESIDVTTDEDKLVLSISDEYVDLINSIPSENQYTLSAGNNISIDAITDDGDDYLVVSTDLTDYLKGSESIDVTTDEDKLVLSISDEYVDLINSIPSENQYTLSAGNNISIDAITDDGDDYLVVSTDLTDYLKARIATDENDLESGFLNIILE